MVRAEHAETAEGRQEGGHAKNAKERQERRIKMDCFDHLAFFAGLA